MSEPDSKPPRFDDYQLRPKPYGGPPETRGTRFWYGWRPYVLTALALAVIAWSWLSDQNPISRLIYTSLLVTVLVGLWVFGPHEDDTHER